MKYLAQLVYIVSMISYIGFGKLGDVNHIILYYSVLWAALLMLNFQWKTKTEKLLSVLNMIFWGGFIFDNLRYWNGDLMEYLSHYDRTVMKVIGLIYIIILIMTLWLQKKKK